MKHMSNFGAEIPQAFRDFARDFHDEENGVVTRPKPGEIEALTRSLEAVELGDLEVNKGGKLVRRESEAVEVE